MDTLQPALSRRWSRTCSSSSSYHAITPSR